MAALGAARLFRLARNPDAVRAGRGGHTLRPRRHRLGGGAELVQRPDRRRVDGDEERAVLPGLVVARGVRPGQRDRQQLDRQGERVPFVAAEREQHPTARVELLDVVRRPPLGVDDPAIRDGRALRPRDAQLALRDGRGGVVQDERRLARQRHPDRDRVRAEHPPGPAEGRRGERAIAPGRPEQADHPGDGRLLSPLAEPADVVDPGDRHERDLARPNLASREVHADVRGVLAEPPGAVQLDDARTFPLDLRARGRHEVARSDPVDVARNLDDAVRVVTG